MSSSLALHPNADARFLPDGLFLKTFGTSSLHFQCTESTESVILSSVLYSSRRDGAAFSCRGVP